MDSKDSISQKKKISLSRLPSLSIHGLLLSFQVIFFIYLFLILWMRYTQLRIFSAPKIFHIWLPNVENTSAAFISRLVAPLDFLVGTALHTVLSLILINNIRSAAFKGELALSNCRVNHGRYCAESLACFEEPSWILDVNGDLPFFMQSFHANLRCSPCSVFDDLTGHRR